MDSLHTTQFLLLSTSPPTSIFVIIADSTLKAQTKHSQKINKHSTHSAYWPRDWLCTGQNLIYDLTSRHTEAVLVFVVWELAHLTFHPCSPFSGHGSLPKGFIIENLQTRLKRSNLQRNFLDILLHLFACKVNIKLRTLQLVLLSDSAICGGRLFHGTCDPGLLHMFTGHWHQVRAEENLSPAPQPCLTRQPLPGGVRNWHGLAPPWASPWHLL